MATQQPSYDELKERIESLQTELPRARVLEAAVDNSGLLVAVMRPDTTVTYASASHETILGYPPEELVGTRGFDLIHPDDKTRLLRLLAKYTKKFIGMTVGKLFGNRESFLTETVEYRIRDKKGNWHWLESIGSIVDGRVFNISRDITDKKQAELEIRKHRKSLEALVAQQTAELKEANRQLVREIQERAATDQALRRSEELYRTLVKASPHAVTMTDLEGRITYASEKALEMHGAANKEALMGKSALELIAEHDRERAMANLQRTLAEGAVSNLEYTLVRNDGSQFMAELNTVLVCDSLGRPNAFVATVSDITERKKMEQELATKQRLESLGVLAGGIAHDFNNALTSILAGIGAASIRAGKAGRQKELLREVEKAALEARGLTQQLLTFARGGEPVKSAVHLGPVLKDSADIALKGSNVRCAFAIDGQLWPVEADESQTRQVFNNLLTNAMQAMPGGGTVRVGAENLSVGDGETAGLKAGDYVKVTVGDEGAGISLEHLPKVFDPFFTTKRAGSGLGLAICHSIVTRHGGLLTVASEPRTGTVFSVWLPRSVNRPKPRRAECGLEGTGAGRILVMDDEQAVRSMVTAVLKALGYEVATSSCGEEAIVHYERALASGAPFRAVIMDLTVARGLGGKAAVDRILARDPQARVLAMSGYSEDPVLAAPREHGFAGSICKPFTASELAAALNQVALPP